VQQGKSLVGNVTLVVFPLSVCCFSDGSSST
jgi:hypothetical protein